MSMSIARGRTARAPRPIVSLALAVVCFGIGAPAHAQSVIIQGWLAANTVCKAGPSDSSKAQKACKLRDALNERLKRRHCEYQEDGDWWRCPH